MRENKRQKAHLEYPESQLTDIWMHLHTSSHTPASRANVPAFDNLQMLINQNKSVWDSRRKIVLTQKETYRAIGAAAIERLHKLVLFKDVMHFFLMVSLISIHILTECILYSKKNGLATSH